MENSKSKYLLYIIFGVVAFMLLIFTGNYLDKRKTELQNKNVAPSPEYNISDIIKDNRTDEEKVETIFTQLNRTYQFKESSITDYSYSPPQTLWYRAKYVKFTDRNIHLYDAGMNVIDIFKYNPQTEIKWMENSYPDNEVQLSLYYNNERYGKVFVILTLGHDIFNSRPVNTVVISYQGKWICLTNEPPRI